jgi:hypothetical protein
VHEQKYAEDGGEDFHGPQRPMVDLNAVVPNMQSI